MKCSKCHKEMAFLSSIQKVSAALVPDGAHRVKVMGRQVILCEHCENPYVWFGNKGKMTTVAATPKWLASQTKAVRKSVEQAIVVAKKGAEAGRLIEYWMKKMEAITE